jgi:hypothetical protein
MPKFFRSFSGIFGVYHSIVKIPSEFFPELLFPRKMAGIAIQKRSPFTKNYKRSPGSFFFAAQGTEFLRSFLRKGDKE